MKLTKEDFQKLNLIADVNKRKSYIQEIVMSKFLEVKKGCFTAFTSFGKNFFIYRLIAIFNKNAPNYKILVVVPREFLRDDIQKQVDKYGFKNVDVKIVNTLASKIAKANVRAYYDLVICDELHNLCGESSLYFSEIIPRLDYKYFLGVSATLDTTDIEYLRRNQLEVFFDVPIEDGFKANLIPDHSIWNVPVDLDPDEKAKYRVIQDEYLSYIGKFSRYDPVKPTDAITACLAGEKMHKYQGVVRSGNEHARIIGQVIGKEGGQVIGLAKKWRLAMMGRKKILNSPRQSISMTVQLINMIPDQVLVFCSSIDTANLIAKLTDGKAYHSKISQKNREQTKSEFLASELKVMCVCNSMKEGFDYPKLRFIICQGYTGKVRDFVQILGRGLRIDKDNVLKQTHLINTYVRDFTVGTTTYKSQQMVWLKNRLRGKSFVNWVNNVKEVNLC